MPKFWTKTRSAEIGGLARPALDATPGCQALALANRSQSAMAQAALGSELLRSLSAAVHAHEGAEAPPCQVRGNATEVLHGRRAGLAPRRG